MNCTFRAQDLLFPRALWGTFVPGKKFPGPFIPGNFCSEMTYYKQTIFFIYKDMMLRTTGLANNHPGKVGEWKFWGTKGREWKFQIHKVSGTKVPGNERYRPFVLGNERSWAPKSPGTHSNIQIGTNKTKPNPNPNTNANSNSVGSFVILCILFGKSKNSLDFERRYHKLYKKLGCHFFFTF